jgi:hypothetical protein
MFDSDQPPTGSLNTKKAIELTVAFVMSPLTLMAARPAGGAVIWLGVACGAVCASLVWLAWTNHAHFPIPLLELQRPRIPAIRTDWLQPVGGRSRA